MTSTPPARFPFSPFPSGWYAQCFSHELGRRGVLTRTFAGREVVLFRAESGAAGMLDAHCPHMGAHLGVGGRVEGETLRCPMHGFRFARDGECIATGYGTKPPPKCVAGTHHVLEQNGLVLAYLGQDAPSWQPPLQDLSGFGPMRTHVLSGVASHPQETTENSVDFGHLAVVHGYHGVDVVKPLATEGAYLTASYRMQRRAILPGTPNVETTFTVHVHGLGYSFVDVVVSSHALATRYFVLATPTDGAHIDLRLAGFLRGHGPLARVPPKLLDRAIGALVFHNFLSDVRQDVPIWSNKICVQPPALAEGDGPVGKYRSWARQFYADSERDSGPVVRRIGARRLNTQG